MTQNVQLEEWEDYAFEMVSSMGESILDCSRTWAGSSKRTTVCSKTLSMVLAQKEWKE